MKLNNLPKKFTFSIVENYAITNRNKIYLLTVFLLVIFLIPKISYFNLLFTLPVKIIVIFIFLRRVFSISGKLFLQTALILLILIIPLSLLGKVSEAESIGDIVYVVLSLSVLTLIKDLYFSEEK